MSDCGVCGKPAELNIAGPGGGIWTCAGCYDEADAQMHERRAKMWEERGDLAKADAWAAQARAARARNLTPGSD